jgi:chromosome segregation ATPase
MAEHTIPTTQIQTDR